MLFLHSILGPGLASANTPLGSSSNSKSILTKVTLKDGTGSVIDAVHNPNADPVVMGAPVTLEYEWELENGHDYVAGSTFEFDIPQEFELYNSVNGILEISGLEIGKFAASKNGHVIVTFDEDVSGYSDVGGTIIFNTNFSKTSITGSTEVAIPFPVRGGNR